MNRDELAILFRHAGLDVDPETVDELQRLSGDIETLIARVNASSEGDPMLVFAPLELTAACSARIEQLQPVLHAFITPTLELAAGQARTAEREIAAATIAVRCTAFRSHSRTSTRRPGSARPRTRSNSSTTYREPMRRRYVNLRTPERS